MKKKKKKILHIGSVEWQENIHVPDNISWYDVRPDEIHTIPITKFVEEKRGKKIINKEVPEVYDVVILSDYFVTGDLTYIEETVNAYAVVCQYGFQHAPELTAFFKKKMPQPLHMDSPQQVVDIIHKNFFNGQYGSKLPISSIDISPNFKGNMHYEGSAYLSLTHQFGQDLSPICFWKYNVMLDKNVAMEIWLEYMCEHTCEIELHVQLIAMGGNEVIKEWTLHQEDMQNPTIFDEKDGGYLSFSLWVKGEGTIQIGALHHRFSNLTYGQFILGGQRYSDEKRQEFIYYFNPGNLKPPLNIYFSGFRPAEGFEGYWMLKSLGHPFLLFGDPRLEGGAFYMGSPEFEQKILSVIQECLTYLNFSNKDMILSGLSMGTFGALYYGSQCSPYAIIIGKPLVNVGSIAGVAQKLRPNEFHTSFDVLKLHTGGISQEHIKQLDERFWTHFSSSTFQNTMIATSYMKHDDYDPSAYYNMIERVGHQSIKIYGNGWIGRHNDNSAAITNWFFTQYKEIIKRDFGGTFE
ncbi:MULTISPECIES: accessory Sec system protein Asp2 [unclassified Granulicatella]|uniref:accessory Sec system protein Asp2 n=1 Tax=unclassified Granulicatella TaxID=2630493 RepID=UPI001431B09F|nr:MULTISPECIES: accessory Sec system protein Asp2 [unclassified Granulicatella]MBF0780165.1 accessory Sec system protein Asp2 [Granulicatella sp. 19428wC4_WM01]